MKRHKTLMSIINTKCDTHFINLYVYTRKNKKKMLSLWFTLMNVILRSILDKLSSMRWMLKILWPLIRLLIHKSSGAFYENLIKIHGFNSPRHACKMSFNMKRWKKKNENEITIAVGLIALYESLTTECCTS